MMYVKVTVDFLVTGATPEAAKNKLDGMLRHTLVPHYNIRPHTEVTGLEGD
jgi:hypothetical protein